MKLNEQIKQYRTKKGMSQEELASKTHTTKSTISKWENGTVVPTIDTVKLISKELNVSFYKLVGQKEPVSKKILNGIGRFFIWIFVWVHIDVTVGFTTMIFGAAFALSAIAGSVGGGITLITFFTMNDVWDTLRIFYVIVIFLSAPVIFFLFGSLALLLMKFTQYLYIFSLRFFWRANINLPKKCIVKESFQKIPKGWRIAITIISIISLLITAAFFTYMGIADQYENINVR